MRTATPQRLIHRMFWDQEERPTADELLELLDGRITDWKGLTRIAVLARMLERWSWEELRDYQTELLPELLSEETLAKVHIEPIRRKYERLGQFLFQGSLSLPGWSDPDTQESSDPVFSNRRNRSGEGISWT